MCVTSRTKPVKKQLEPPPPGPPPPPSECREQASETNAAHVWQNEFCPLIVIWREWEGPSWIVYDLNYTSIVSELVYLWESVCSSGRVHVPPATQTSLTQSGSTTVLMHFLPPLLG